jgi:hypothetical protein
LYFSMGKPVVAPNLQEASTLEGLAYLATNDDHYISLVRRALAEPAANRTPRIAYASQFSFDRTLDAIAGRVADCMRSDRGGSLVDP